MKTVYTLFLVVFCLFASAQADKVSIQLKLTEQHTGSFDLTTIAFQGGYQTTYNVTEDVQKVLNNGTSGAQFFTYSSDNVACAINGYSPLVQTETVSAGVNLYHTANYAISINGSQNVDPTTLIFLIDSETGQTYNLSSGAYQFTADSGLYANRFSVRVSSPVTAYSIPANCSNQAGVVNVAIEGSTGWTKVVLVDSNGSIAGFTEPVAGPVSFGALGEGSYTVQLFNEESNVSLPVVVTGYSLVAGINVATTVVNANQPLLFAGMANKASYYTWNMGDGTTITGVANPEYAFLTPGVYEVTLRIANDFGCSDSATKTITVLEATGITKAEEGKTDVYTTGKILHVKMGKEPVQQTRLSVYNIIGQDVFNAGVEGIDNRFDLTLLEPGTYIVRIEQGRAIQTQKIYIR
jgi:PKD repeat protein